MEHTYTWECFTHPNSTPLRWRLLKGFWRTNGVLVKGGRKNPGWVVWDDAEIIARMNPNLTLDEAQDAAKALLLMGAKR